MKMSSNLSGSNLAVSTNDHQNKIFMFFDPGIPFIEIYPKKNVEKAVYPNIFIAFLLIIVGNLGKRCTSIDKWLSKS